MIHLQEIHSGDAKLYAYVEQLLVVTFPKNEYRPLSELKANTDHQENFHLDVLWEDALLVGFIAYWDFEKFCYWEYFVIDDALRNKGYGSKALQCFCRTFEKPIVLEIELPDTAEACRRKEFYERNHFVVWPNDYFQPPFRKEDNSLPVMLCCRGNLNPGVDFEWVRHTLYTQVYKYFEK